MILGSSLALRQLNLPIKIINGSQIRINKDKTKPALLILLALEEDTFFVELDTNRTVNLPLFSLMIARTDWEFEYLETKLCICWFAELCN